MKMSFTVNNKFRNATTDASLINSKTIEVSPMITAYLSIFMSPNLAFSKLFATRKVSRQVAANEQLLPMVEELKNFRLATEVQDLFKD